MCLRPTLGRLIEGCEMVERRILNSWKEIAAYLGRGVRTVQRWEAQLGLPVHRPAGKDHSAVVAFSSELEQWLDSRPVRQIAGMQLLTSSPQTADMRELVGRAEMLLQKLNSALVRS